MDDTNTILKIDIHEPVHFNWSGLFVSPGKDWVHMKRRLADFELMVVQRGVLYIEDEHGRYEVHEGEYILMPPTQLQKGYKSSECSFYWMHFTPYLLDAYEAFTAPHEQIVFKPKYVTLPKGGALTSKDRVYILMQQLSDMEKRYLDVEANSFLATSVLCEIQNQFKYAAHQEVGKDTMRFEKIKDYIASHIAEELLVKDIAEHFGYNEKYLTTSFRRKYNISIKQYIIAAKIERAKFLLCNTNASISEISDNLSYWNVQSFSTAFKKCTEVTPSDYRNMYFKGLVNNV
ncbi:MAG: AraC family transcriptional regulator [Lachnospiraceae bacterium]|nr:AraC family transcriptional regulator [Lachnospiraceae bacterium]